MNLTGEIKEISYTPIGEPIIQLKINRTNESVKIDTLSLKEPIKVKIEPLKKMSRTLRQNNLMWGVIGDIDKGLNGYPTESGRWEVYLDGLEELGVEFEDYKIPSASIKFFKENYRKYKVIEEYGTDVIIRCFVGSSKFNKAQMGELIDYFIRYAAKLQIPIRSYMDEWEVLFG